MSNSPFLRRPRFFQSGLIIIAALAAGASREWSASVWGPPLLAVLSQYQGYLTSLLANADDKRAAGAPPTHQETGANGHLTRLAGETIASLLARAADNVPRDENAPEQGESVVRALQYAAGQANERWIALLEEMPETAGQAAQAAELRKLDGQVLADAVADHVTKPDLAQVLTREQWSAFMVFVFDKMDCPALPSGLVEWLGGYLHQNFAREFYEHCKHAAAREPVTFAAIQLHFLGCLRAESAQSAGKLDEIIGLLKIDKSGIGQYNARQIRELGAALASLGRNQTLLKEELAVLPPKVRDVVSAAIREPLRGFKRDVRVAIYAAAAVGLLVLAVEGGLYWKVKHVPEDVKPVVDQSIRKNKNADPASLTEGFAQIVGEKEKEKNSKLDPVLDREKINANEEHAAELKVSLQRIVDEAVSKDEANANFFHATQLLQQNKLDEALQSLELKSAKEDEEFAAIERNRKSDELHLRRLLQEKLLKASMEEEKLDFEQAANDYRGIVEKDGQWVLPRNRLVCCLVAHASVENPAEGDRDLEEALQVCESAVAAFPQGQYPEDWAGMERTRAVVLMEKAERTHGKERQKLLADAVAALHGVEKIFTRRGHAEDWARTQELLGSALQDQAMQATGEESRQLLAQAVAACEASLEVLTPAKRMAEWSYAEKHLASALKEQIKRGGGEDNQRRLENVIGSLRQALHDLAASDSRLRGLLSEPAKADDAAAPRQLINESVAVTRAAVQSNVADHFPRSWAEMQNNLGDLLVTQARMASGEERQQRCKEAVSVYRDAQKVITRDRFPMGWAHIQNSVGEALRLQAQRANKDESLRLLEKAREACASAADVFPSEQFPEESGRVKLNLAGIYLDLVDRANENACPELLQKAVAACEVAVRDIQLPENRAETQMGLGNTLYAQATHASEKERAEPLAKAVEAYWAVLTVFTHDQFPPLWAKTRYRLATVLCCQAEVASEKDRPELLAQAEQACRDAISVPQAADDWADAQMQLGTVLVRQAERAAEKDRPALYAQAVQAYRAAREVFTAERFPHEWAAVHFNLAGALVSEAEYLEGPAREQALEEAVADSQVALQFFTPDHLPETWAAAVGIFASARVAQAGLKTGPELRQLAEEATEALEKALKTLSHDQFPHSWAQLQEDLGDALHNRAEQLGENESGPFLARAETAYRAALDAFEPDRFPLHRAQIQLSLGLVYDREAQYLQSAPVLRAAQETIPVEQFPELWALAQLEETYTICNQCMNAPQAEKAKFFDSALKSYRVALNIYKQKLVQDSSAVMVEVAAQQFMMSALRSSGDGKKRCTFDAVQTCEEALQVLPADRFPQQRAIVQEWLGRGLMVEYSFVSKAERPRLLTRMEAVCRAALDVLTLENAPEDWARSKEFLGLSLIGQAEQIKGRKGQKLLSEGTEACRAALDFHTKAGDTDDQAKIQQIITYAQEKQKKRKG